MHPQKVKHKIVDIIYKKKSEDNKGRGGGWGGVAKGRGGWGWELASLFLKVLDNLGA